jgi:hypothetical protein
MMNDTRQILFSDMKRMGQGMSDPDMIFHCGTLRLFKLGWRSLWRFVGPYTI